MCGREMEEERERGGRGGGEIAGAVGGTAGPVTLRYLSGGGGTGTHVGAQWG